MAEQAIRLPDVGEGVAEAELVEWHVRIGEIIQEDAILAAVMTDKATVEIPSPISGEIVWLAAKVGDVVAVGSDLVRIKVQGASDVRPPKADVPAAATEPAATSAAKPLIVLAEPAPAAPVPTQDHPARIAQSRLFSSGAPRPEGEKPLASPAVRLRAMQAGLDLRQIRGTGPAGRVTHQDLDVVFTQGPNMAKAPGLRKLTAVEDIKVVGLRRKIAERMSIANARIPHITYVEEVDVTTLEQLRATLNAGQRHDRLRLTLLPFLMRAMVRAIAEQPALKALFDDGAGVLRQHAGVHIGIAAQTSLGLMVPVVRHAEALDLWQTAAEISRLSAAAREGKATRDELGGSTITITSLGPIGGIVTTPVINYPEVAIIGVNRVVERPVVRGGQIVIRKMMNLSSSFDHRVVDGWDAAQFIQELRRLIEQPATLFVA